MKNILVYMRRIVDCSNTILSIVFLSFSHLSLSVFYSCSHIYSVGLTYVNVLNRLTKYTQRMVRHISFSGLPPKLSSYLCFAFVNSTIPCHVTPDPKTIQRILPNKQSMAKHTVHTVLNYLHSVCSAKK